jgi:hypothetical protein
MREKSRMCCSGPERLPAARRRISSSSSSIALRAMSATGCRMVVSAGQIVVASGVSSKPTTVRSPGTSSRRRCATAIAAAAMSSLLANMALGRRGLDSICSAAMRPEW